MRSKLIVSVCMVFTAVAVFPRFAAASEDNTQTAELHQLQEAFHAAGSVHDNINGDSADVITQRIRDMMSLWTRDGVMMLAVGGAFDGKYMGRGDPDDPSTCPEPSSDSNNRGTLCTLFKYVHGAFKPANKLISLTSAYKTSFDVEGNLATFYFECHYFNVAIDPNTGTPFWTAATHLSLNGVAQKVHGQWRLAYGIVHVPPVPLPVP